MIDLTKSFKLKFLVVGVTAALIFIFTSPLVLAKGKKHNLKKMIKEAGENVEKADVELKEKEAEKRNREREVEIREHFEKGNALYKEGKLKEAKKEWQKVLEMSKDPEMRDYIRGCEKRAKEEKLVRRKEERERERKLKAEQKEKERRELEDKRRLEAEKREQKRKQKEEQAKLKRQKREEEVIRKKEEQRRKKEEGRLEKKLRKEELAGKKEKKAQQKRLETEKRKRQSLVRKEQKRVEAEKKRTERERLKDERSKQKKKEKEKKGLEKKRQRVRVKEIAEGSEGATKIKLEDLNYKTEKECLDVLEKKPEDKEAFDNLVKLYRLQNKSIERGKGFHNKGDYQSAIKEFKKALAIEPGNKKVIRWMKKAKSKLNR
ncbi:MAG: hypothetical protein U9Q24_04815 [Candidatus Ratteibacteria bacterium]|nr:hypothetical protein [Candidatus Ratteibacteria bacterium]